MRAGLLVMALSLAACNSLVGSESFEPTGRWAMATGGEQHTCAIRLDGTLWCWGYHLWGVTGLGVDAGAVDTPQRVGDALWTTVSAGLADRWHSCGIQRDGSLWCWGRNDAGELGTGTTEPSLVPVVVEGDTWRDVGAGTAHTCAISEASVLSCWGDGTDGQLGDGQFGSRTRPAAIVGDARWTQLSAGRAHTCALREDKSLWCWGSNDNGQLGVAPSELERAATPLQIEGTWRQVATGHRHTCALSTEQRVHCWGDGSLGQLGTGSTTPADTPQLPAPIASSATDWVEIAARRHQSCARHADGSVECWGDNQYGALGIETSPDVVASPIPWLPGTRWAALFLGGRHICAIDDARELSCIGSNDHGQLGVGKGDSRGPTRVSETMMFTAVSAGETSVCAIDIEQRAWCWGRNNLGQLGDGTVLLRQRPVLVTGDHRWTAIDVGYHSTCGIRTDNTLMCWGSNVDGVLGTGTDPHGSPTVEPVEIMTDVVATSGNGFSTVPSTGHRCAIKSDGTLHCWGSNNLGQVAEPVSDTTKYLTKPDPVAHPAGLAWKRVATGDVHTCATDTDNQLYCWGGNNAGRLGIGTTTGLQVVPMRIESLPEAIALDLGWAHGCALNQSTVAGRIYCWGANDSGAIGDGTTDVRPSPTFIFVSSLQFMRIAAGTFHTCAIQHGTSGNALWCWGGNLYGQLGDGSETRRTAPDRVGSDNDWTEVSTGDTHTCALKADRSLWCWGKNEFGQRGDGTTWLIEPQKIP